MGCGDIREDTLPLDSAEVEHAPTDDARELDVGVPSLFVALSALKRFEPSGGFKRVALPKICIYLSKLVTMPLIL